MASKNTIHSSKFGIFYMFETRVGLVGSTIAGVKIGTSVNEVYERLRAYEQPGTQYVTSAWRGSGPDVAFLEEKFKQHLDSANMRHSFSTSCEEVFIGPKDEFMDNVEEIISYYKLPIKFHVDGYHCLNKTQHRRYLQENAWTTHKVNRLYLPLEINDNPNRLTTALKLDTSVLFTP